MSDLEFENLPVGAHLEVTFGNKSTWCECVILKRNQIIAVDIYGEWEVMEWRNDFEFRHLRTEREKTVDAVIDCCTFYQSLDIVETYRSAFEQAFDNGFLKMPEGK